MAYDLAIVGSGGAGFAAAIAARRAGASVAMVEHGRVGGTCVNTGCVPSKALLAAAELRHVTLGGGRFPGVTTSAGPVDFAELIAGKEDLVGTMRTAKYTNLAQEYGWPIIAGAARFIDGPRLEVNLDEGGRIQIDAAHYLVATGSAAWIPPIPGLAQAGYLTSTTAMELDTLPESMLVVGGNAIGLEQAQLFARLGTKVTIVEALAKLAPFDEPEASHAIESVFADEGIDVHCGAAITSLRRENGRIIMDLRTAGGHESELVGEQLLVATGRRPATAHLNLSAAAVKLGNRGEVLVDDQLRTSNPRIFAAGDVTGHPQFVYVAANDGHIAAENAVSQAGRTVDHRFLPKVTFTSPAMASVGLTEEQATAAGYRCEVRVLPLEHVPRAVVNRDTRGLIKLVAEAGTGRLLGIHAVMESAGELAAAGVYVLTAGMTVEQVAGMWAPYLTMAEGLKLAAQTFTRNVSILSCCAA